MLLDFNVFTNSWNLPALKLGSYKIRADALEKFLTEYEGKDLTNLDDVKELPIIKK